MATRTLTDTARIAWAETPAGVVSADIVADSVSNALAANMATATIKGRSTAGTGDPEDLTAAQVAAIIDSFFLTPAEGNAAYQPLDADLTTLGGLAKTLGNIIVGNGTAWTARQGEINVRDHGALGDGATNDAAAFNAAIAKADALSSGGGVVRAPAGIYMLGSEVTIPAGVIIVGDGQGTIIRPLAVITALFNITGGLAGVVRCELGNVSSRATSGIRCTKGADNLPIAIANNLIASFPNGISWSAGDRPLFRKNVFIANTTCVLLTEDARAGEISSNYMLGGNGISSVFTTQQAEGLLIARNQIFPTSAGNIGVYFEGGLHNIIESNVIDQTGAGGSAIHLAGNADPVAQIKIKNNWCAGGSGGGAGLRSVGNVAGLSSSGNTYTSTNTSSAIGIDASDLQRAEFLGDSTFALTGKAYQMANCDLVSMRDCKFNNGAQGTEDGNCSILWSGSEGVPTSRSNSSVYDRNWVSQVNNLNTEGSITANPVKLSATGTDTDINISLEPKGNSAVTTPNCYRSFSPTLPNGYGAGAGGAVTQATDKTTGVTLNKVCGQITMAAGNLVAGAVATFTLTNSAIATTDVVACSVDSGGTVNAYTANCVAVGAGSCAIQLRNATAGALNEAGVIVNFAVIRAVAS